MSDFLKVEFSAENTQQANDILNALLAKKLVTGGQIVAAPARFLWKGEVTNMPYYTVWSFTKTAHKATIIKQVKQVSTEEVPMIWFTPLDSNDELEVWIKETVV